MDEKLSEINMKIDKRKYNTYKKIINEITKRIKKSLRVRKIEMEDIYLDLYMFEELEIYNVLTYFIYKRRVIENDALSLIWKNH